MSKATTRAKFKHSGEFALPNNGAGHAPSLRVIPWHSPYNARKKHGKSFDQGSLKVPVEHDLVCRHGHLFTGSYDKFLDSGLVSPGKCWESGASTGSA